MAVDPHWANVVLRLTTTTRDEDSDLSPVGNTLSYAGGITGLVVDPQSPYVSDPGSWYYPYQNAATTINELDPFLFGSGDFTVEVWSRAGATVWQESNIIGLYRTISGARSWTINVARDNSYNAQLSLDGNTAAINWRYPAPTDTWVHLCLERSGTVVRFYANGVMQNKQDIGTAALHSPPATERCRVNGSRTTSSGATNWQTQYICDIRVTKGVARYGTDAGFAVPTEAYPVGGSPSSVEVTPPAGELTFEGLGPTLIQGLDVTAVSGAMVISGAIPTLAEFSGVTPEAGALVLSGHVPTLEASGFVDPAAGTLRLAGAAPDVFIGVTVAPGDGILSISGGTPGVFTISGAVSSQAAMLGLVQPPPPPSRASQLAAMALAEPPPPPTRASQTALMAIGEIVPVVAASQAAILALGQGSSCISYRCQLWTIRRRDGVVFRYTSHDQPVHRGPFVYSPCRSLDPTASENSSTLGSVGNIELTGIIDDEGISEADLYGGLFDDAYVTVDLYSWGDQAEAPRRLAAGWTGEVSQGSTAFQMEVLGPAARLDQQALVQMVTPGCRWIFGDSRCGVDVEAMRLSGTVAAARTRGHLFVDVPAPPPGRQWANGRIRFTSGRNAGQIVETKSVDFGVGEVVTWVSPGFLAEPGDAIELLPGCDLSRDGGCTLYQNVVNFGGFPDVPGSDALLESPDAKY